MTSESHNGEVRLDGAAPVITFVRRLPVRPEVVWNALTAPDQLAGWLAAGYIDQRAGGAVLIDFGDGGKVTGEVLICDPPHVLDNSGTSPARPAASSA
jgi:uncharacterized protein YndB with AHSA1/START domain